jgi:filamentous hemagglutinin family protein
MTRTATHIASNRRRHAALLAGCALGLVLAAMPRAAFAQDANKGFQGTPAVDAGGAVFSTPAGGKFTGINVTTPQTVITWTPDDPATSGTIDYLPNGYSAAFGSALADYTVLNRILPGGTATIGINGTITSSVNSGSTPGGNVWFYTPNGFIVGPSAVLQVGGLVMTTNDITYSINPASGIPNFLDANGAINFRGPDGSNGSIVNSGSITSSSYIALVAPRIVQSGYVSASGSVAYVAAEQADLTINAGNFDIVVGQGTTDANGIVHDGTTTGSASTGSTDRKTMQFVAVPKNTALTMLLSGGIGYVPAASAFNDGSAIVLSAGADGSPDGNITIGAADFANRVDGHATGDLTVAPPPPGAFTEGTANTIFESFATLNGDKSVHVTAAGGTRIEARNGLSIYSDSAAGGGDITIQALAGGGLTPAGVIAVTNYLSADASHYGATSDDGTTGLDSQGGSVTLAADGGQISSPYTYLYAGGYGGFGTKTGGDGFGGQIDMRAGFGGDITTSYLSANAEGHGGGSYEFTNAGAVGGQGGIGDGGDITLKDSSGTLAEDPTGGHLGIGSVYLDSSAVGGNSVTSGSGLGGDAFGGTIGITLDRQDQTFGFFDGHARAADGDGGAVDPVGGDITMTVGGGIALTLDTLHFDTGVYASINSPAGAFGKGGTIDVSVIDGASVTVTNNASLDSLAEVSPFFGAATSSPDLTGGSISLLADNGTFQANNIFVDVSAYNVGADVTAGFAQGGSATVRAANGGSIAAVLAPNSIGGDGLLRIDAEGYGTGGTSANSVTGGDITLASETGGTISAGSGTINLNAKGEFGIVTSGQAMGVIAQGGGITIEALGGTIATGVYADAGAQGGDADNAGGSGTGGTIDVRVLGGTLVNSLYASAEGFGGATFVKGDGGDGKGGRFTFTSDADATFTDFGLTFYGNGYGGTAFDGTGGDGTGGSAQVDILGGTHTWFSAYLSAQGYGARSLGATSLAGSAHGSLDDLNFHVGGGADLTLFYLTLDGRATAYGDGGANETIGGGANLLVDQLASLTADSIGINASAQMAFEERDPTSYDSTPTAQGGGASAIADGGTITTPYLEVVSNGTTGGALTSAGTATGGLATIGASAGGLVDIVAGIEGGGLTLEARGFGAEGPSAAHAEGGTAALYTAGGAISSVYDITVNADAEAGEFANYFVFAGPANGMNATGGTASVEMRAGGSGGAISAPSLTVTAQGIAEGIEAVEGAGGIGQGGTATLDVAQGALATGSILVTADGRGGRANENSSGGAAFVSGDGNGGTAGFDLSGGSVTTNSVELAADGWGALGVGFTAGATPANTGAGAGGTASFNASGGTLTDAGDLFLHARGIGGNGDFNANSGPGQDGGDAFGGTASLTAPAGGTATLGIGGAVRLVADASGGAGGFSASSVRGNGGDAEGGTASISLADIPFTFGLVSLNANGFAGSGAGGTGTGGTASFALADTLGGAIAPRVIDRLSLQASSSGITAAIAGATSFASQAGSPDSGLTITTDLTAIADGATAPAGYGFTGVISGAPVTVGGRVIIATPRDAILTISDPGALDVTGDLSITVGRTFASSGVISTDANASVIANDGIAMTDLSVGGTTLLRAINGPVIVSRNLSSVGPVTVLGRSVDLTSLGGLTFTDADATAGNLDIETAGDLLLATVDATGAVTLTSTGGSIHNTGAVNGVGIFYTAAGDVTSDAALASGGALGVDAGGVFSAPSVSAVGNVSLSADLGMTLTSVTSGGTTFLAADAGALSVDSLTSPGLVTASGRSVTIGSPGALSFANAQATAGDLAITTAGDLSLAQAGATGAVDLTSTGGSVTGTGPITSGGNAAVAGQTGIALAALTSGGTTSLTSANGAVAVTNLNSAGAVTASGRSVTIGSSGALTFADLDATAGDIIVETAGTSAFNTVDATGSVSLTSTGGALQLGGAIDANGIALSSLADLTLSGGLATVGSIALTSTGGSVTATAPVSAGGNLAVSGNSGIALGTATSGGTTSLTSANGAVAVTNLNSAGPVTASGRSVDLASPGSLTVSSAQASGGDLRLQTAQGLTVGNGSASGTATLIGGTDLLTTGVLTATNARLEGVTVTVGGQMRATGDLGVLASQLFTLSGLAEGRTIAVDTGDIAIGSTGRLGSRGLTQSIALRNLALASPMNIGGTDQSGQFSLDKDEATRLFADQQISFISRGSEGVGGDVRIGDLALAFGPQANIGAGGLLKVDAGGLVEVNGAVALTTVSDADTFSIDPTRIDVIAGSGSIAMRSASGVLQGLLELEAGTIAVADRATLDAIGTLTDFAAISAALDQPGLAGPEGGYLQAGTINLIAGDSIFIQNGGATTEYDDRRGFLANQLNIETSSSDPMIAINGVIATPAGNLVGLDTAQAVSINGIGAAGLPNGVSVTINGCAAGTRCGVPPYTFGGQSNDDLELVVRSDGAGQTAEDAQDGENGTNRPSEQLIQLEDNEPLITPPMVDEPITGVGNDDLWQVKCTPEGDKSGCPTEEGTE